MKDQYRLYRRGNIFYAQNNITGKQESLGTRDKSAAKQILAAKNASHRNAALNVAIAEVHLKAQDPALCERTWSDVFREFSSRGKAKTRERRERAMRSIVFDRIREKKLYFTTAEDFRAVMSSGKTSVIHNLRCVHNLARGENWLQFDILGVKQWPKGKKKPKRAITREEHERIIGAEKNSERRLYYEIIWNTGAAQSDAAKFSCANVDWTHRTFGYVRQKTGEHAILKIGPALEQVLQQLPKSGPFFPNIVRSTDGARSAEFCRRIRLLGIQGVSLHSYRRSWAQRAKACGYSRRWAESALGHKSPAVHDAYANGAYVECPAQDVKWLSDATRILSAHWAKKNRGANKPEEGNPTLN